MMIHPETINGQYNQQRPKRTVSGSGLGTVVDPSPVGIGRIDDIAATQETTSRAQEQPVYDATIPEHGAVTQSDPTLELLRSEANVTTRIALAQKLHAMIKDQNGKGGPMGQPRR